jgi:hypothetical protein
MKTEEISLGKQVRFDQPNGTIILGYITDDAVDGLGGIEVVECYAVHKSPSVSGASYKLRGMFHSIPPEQLQEPKMPFDHFASNSLRIRLEQRSRNGDYMAHTALEAIGWA